MDNLKNMPSGDPFGSPKRPKPLLRSRGSVGSGGAAITTLLSLALIYAKTGSVDPDLAVSLISGAFLGLIGLWGRVEAKGPLSISRLL